MFRLIGVFAGLLLTFVHTADFDRMNSELVRLIIGTNRNKPPGYCPATKYTGEVMSNFLADFARDESGASAAEYVILVGVMGALVAGGAFLFGGKLKTAMTDAGDKTISCVNNAAGTC